MVTEPHIQFKETPKTFSDKSKILEILKEDYRSGIILDNLEELKNAFIVYNGGLIDESDATQDDIKNNIKRTGGDLGLGLLHMATAGKSDDFAEKLANRALIELSEKGRFRRDFDYDAMGTNFFKTTVEVEKVDDKIVLELNAAYVGDKPERNLAKVLKKPLALRRSDAKAKLSIVDGWWFNADVKELLGNLPVDKKQLVLAAQHIADSYKIENPNIKFPYGGKIFDLDIGLDAARYLRSETGKEYLHARGSSIIGASWAIYAEDGNTKIPPTPKSASLTLSVSPTGQRYSRSPIVKDEEVKLTQEARDYLIKKLM